MKIKQIHMPAQRLPYHALLTSTVTVEKHLDFAWKGDIVDAVTERDYEIGLYAFPTVEKRDRFVSMINQANEFRPCIPVDIFA